MVSIWFVVVLAGIAVAGVAWGFHIGKRVGWLEGQLEKAEEPHRPFPSPFMRVMPMPVFSSDFFVHEEEYMEDEESFLDDEQLAEISDEDDEEDEECDPGSWLH